MLLSASPFSDADAYRIAFADGPSIGSAVTVAPLATGSGPKITADQSSVNESRDRFDDAARSVLASDLDGASADARWSFGDADSAPLASILFDEPMSEGAVQGPTTPPTITTIAWPDTSDYINALEEVYVAEGRYGDAGGHRTFELDHGPSTAAPFAEAQWNWGSGVDYDFKLVYTPNATGGGSFSFSQKLSTATSFGNLLNDYTITQWEPSNTDTNFIRSQAFTLGSAMRLSNLTLTTPTVTGAILVDSAGVGKTVIAERLGGPTRDTIQVTGVDLQAGLTLEGTTEMLWSSPDPKNSQLAYQVKVGNHQFVDLDVDSNYDSKVDKADESAERTRGGIVVRDHDGVYEDAEQPARRKRMNLQSSLPPGVTGDITLTPSGDDVRVFTAETDGTEITFNGTDNAWQASTLPETLWLMGGENASTAQADKALILTGPAVAGTIVTDEVGVTVLWVDIEQRKHSATSINGDGSTGFASGGVINDATTHEPLGVTSGINPKAPATANAIIEEIGVVSATGLTFGSDFDEDFKEPRIPGETNLTYRSYGEAAVELGFLWNRVATVRYYVDQNAEPRAFEGTFVPTGTFITRHADDSFAPRQDTHIDSDATLRSVIADIDAPNGAFAPGTSFFDMRANFEQWVTLNLNGGADDTPAAEALVVAAAERVSSREKWAARLDLEKDDKGTPTFTDDVAILLGTRNDGMGTNEVMVGSHIPLSLDGAGPSINSVSPSAVSAAVGTTIINLSGSNLDPAASVSLVKGSIRIEALATQWVSTSTHRARFDFSSVPADTYDLTVTNPDGLDFSVPFIVHPAP